MMKLSQIGEFGFINLIKKELGFSPSVIRGIGDDTDVVEVTSDKYLLLTTDMLVEGAHFTRRMSAQAIGRKAMACNISDIAAMGGIPKYALISSGLPNNLTVQFVKDMYKGMNAIAKGFGVVIVGGDTVKSQKIIINVALTGEVKKNKVVLRSGARVGDRIFVTGALGKSLLSGRHFTFKPRLQESQYLVKHFNPTAMIDISDGLAADLGHILEESKVGAVIEEQNIPKNQGADLTNALYDGEDFELVFTLSPREAVKLLQSKSRLFHFYKIGRVTSQPNVLKLLDRHNRIRPIALKGYAHF